MPSKATMEQTDAGYRQCMPQPPKYTIATKQEMVIGGSVPSWTNSIPGPKYKYDIDVIKERQAVYSIGEKIDMVIGGGVPSWTNSIPGPKYSYDSNVFKERQPVYTMGGTGRGSPKNENPEDKKMLENDKDEAARLEKAIHFTKKSCPSFTMSAKQENVIGGDVVSWKRSIPGPYNWDAGQIRPRQPCFTIGTKLPDESDLMSVRSPGPIYGGAASDVGKQALVDSTKRRSFSCSFGVGPRWEGVTQELLLTGAWGRYDKARPRTSSAAPTGKTARQAARSASQSGASKKTASVAK